MMQDLCKGECEGIRIFVQLLMTITTFIEVNVIMKNNIDEKYIHKKTSERSFCSWITSNNLRF